MKIHELTGKVSGKRKRVGRGIGSGTGKTAGRGTKGQKSRTGHHKMPAAFEGGQMPIHMRLPKKRGFKGNPKARKITITLDRIERAFTDGEVVTADALVEKGLIEKGETAKIVASGELKKSLTIKVPLSQGAAAAIEKAGGQAAPEKK